MSSLRSSRSAQSTTLVLIALLLLSIVFTSEQNLVTTLKDESTENVVTNVGYNG
jgi:hypothetical protein